MRKMLTSKDEEALKELLYKGFLDTDYTNTIYININMATLISDNDKVLITQDSNYIYLDFSYFYSKSIDVSLAGVSPKDIKVYLPAYCDFSIGNDTGKIIYFDIKELIGRTIFIVDDSITSTLVSYLISNDQTTVQGVTDGRISFATIDTL